MNVRHVNRLDELPRDVAPARDLWPGIAAAIENERAAARPAPGRRGWWPVPAVAAAIALVTFGVFIGRSFAPATLVPVAGTSAPPGGYVTAALRDADYRRQRDQLLVQVQERLDSMPEAERGQVAASLATLRRSIGEIEAALGRDPANALLQELLVSSCQEEMRALTAVRDAGRQEI